MAYKWETLDPNQAAPPSDPSGTFKISTAPDTDIWRPSPDKDVFNAPGLITRVRTGSFKSFSASVSADWKTLFDQGGILIAFPSKAGGTVKDVKRWVKAGVEVMNGAPKLGVVGTDSFSDWSLVPLVEDGPKASFKAVREGQSLWIYAVKNGEDVPLREITWAFIGDRDSDAEMWVGVYAAKPTSESHDSKQGLDVTFETLKLETV